MNTFHQDKSLLIGSSEAIAALAKKESAALLIVSDSHYSPSILYRILVERGSRADALIFCGDGMGDIASLFEKAQKEESFSYCMPPVISIVEGNGDADRYPVLNPDYEKNKHSDYYAELQVPVTQKFTVARHVVFSTHGHRYSLLNGTNALARAAKKENADLVFYGHTHLALAEQKPSMLVLNPGSCARPRGGQPPCFAEVRVKSDSLFFEYSFHIVTASGDFPGYIPDIVPTW